MNQFELTDMNDYRLIPQLVERMNEQMRIEGEKFICERLMDLHIDKDILFNQTQEIRRLNGILQEYKDKEEQGLLLELPCKVGDTVYLIHHFTVARGNGILKCNIDEFTVDGSNCCYAVLNGNESYYALRRFRAVKIENFGETVFLTRTEAEEALAKMGE